MMKQRIKSVIFALIMILQSMVLLLIIQFNKNDSSQEILSVSTLEFPQLEPEKEEITLSPPHGHADIMFDDLEESLSLQFEKIQEELDLMGAKLDNLSPKTSPYKLISPLENLPLSEKEELWVSREYDLAVSLYKDDSYGEALPLLFRSLNHFPYDGRLRFYYLDSLFREATLDPYLIAYLRQGLTPYLQGSVSAKGVCEQFKVRILNIFIALDLEEERPKKALERYELLLTLDHGGDSLKSMALLEYELSDFEGASKHLSRYLFFNDDDQARYYRVLSLIKLKNHKGALEEIGKMRGDLIAPGELDRLKRLCENELEEGTL